MPAATPRKNITIVTQGDVPSQRSIAQPSPRRDQDRDDQLDADTQPQGHAPLQRRVVGCRPRLCRAIRRRARLVQALGKTRQAVRRLAFAHMGERNTNRFRPPRPERGAP